MADSAQRLAKHIAAREGAPGATWFAPAAYVDPNDTAELRRQHRPFTAVHRLRAAVLEVAAADLLCDARTPEAERRRALARDWFTCRRERWWTFSFVACCEAVGVHPGYLWARLEAQQRAVLSGPPALTGCEPRVRALLGAHGTVSVQQLGAWLHVPAETAQRACRRLVAVGLAERCGNGRYRAVAPRTGGDAA